MLENQSSVLHIERGTGSFAVIFPLEILIDDEAVGSVWSRKPGEFVLDPGRHVVSARLAKYEAEAVCIELRPGRRAVLRVEAKPVPKLGPWHLWPIGFILALAIAHEWVGEHFPAVRVFLADYLTIPCIIVASLAVLGMLRFFWKNFIKERWRAGIFFKLPESGSFQEMS